MRVVVSLLIIALVLGVYLNLTVPIPVAHPLLHFIFPPLEVLPPPVQLQNFSICPSNCIYPSPFIEGEVVIDYSSDMRSMQFLVNGVGDPPRNFTVVPSPTSYIYLFKGGSLIPVQSGQTYNLAFIIVFGDGFSYSASINVAAD
jgi:hypothetical protein